MIPECFRTRGLAGNGTQSRLQGCSGSVEAEWKIQTIKRRSSGNGAVLGGNSALGVGQCVDLGALKPIQGTKSFSELGMSSPFQKLFLQ